MSKENHEVNLNSKLYYKYWRIRTYSGSYYNKILFDKSKFPSSYNFISCSTFEDVEDYRRNKEFLDLEGYYWRIIKWFF